MRFTSLSNKKFVYFLVLLGFGMTVAAWTIDYRDFFEVPWYLWLFIPICPLYPMLLAANYGIFLRRGSFNQPLLHFTGIGIIAYGVMAYIFYPYYMSLNEFRWYEFGNILWVTLYAAQIFLLLPHMKKIAPWWYVIFAAYYVLKDFLDRFSVTFSYVRFGEFTDAQANLLFGAILFLHLGALFFVALHRKGTDQKT